MTGWRRAALMAALITAVGVGAVVAPVAFGQTKVLARTQSPRAVEIFGGGSRIGVSIRDLEDVDSKSIKGVTSGVVVEEVSNDSPADKAGIRKGDVIVEFDGERVRSVRQLTRLVQETPAGRSVQATLVRDGQRSTVTVVPSDSGARFFERFGADDLDNFRYRIAPRPPSTPTPPDPPAVWRFDDLLGRTGRLGVTLDNLSPQLAEYFGAKQGVLVTSVTDNSPAAKAGVKAGDVITAFNGSPVDDPADVRRRVQDARDGDQFTIEVMRERKPLTLKGQIERTERRRTSRSIV